MAENENSIASLIQIIKSHNEESLAIALDQNAVNIENREILSSIDATLKNMLDVHTGFIRRLEQRYEIQDSRPVDAPDVVPPTPPGSSDTEPSDGNNLGALGLALAGLLGALKGVILGQLKAIQAFAKAMTPAALIKRFNGIVDSIKNNIRGIRTAVSMNLMLLKDSIIERLGNLKANAVKAFDDVASFVRGLFRPIQADSRLARIISSAVNRVNIFVDIFKDGLKVLGSGLSFIASKIGKAVSTTFNALKTVGGLVAKFSLFRAVMSAVSKVVSKLFAPLAIIITAFDTIKGAIDGYAEGGLIGAIEGAVKGFYNSLIFGPADMIKSAAAWVLGFFGFDKAKAALNSFSFQETFNNIVGTLFDGVEGVFNWISTLVTDPVAALSQLWNGITGGAASIGRWIYDIAIGPAVAWVKDMFNWDEGNEEESGLIGKLFDSTIEKIKNFFSELFDFLPSMEEIKASFRSILPSWLGGGSSNQETPAVRQDLEEEVQRLMREQSSAPTTDQANQMMDYVGKTKEEYDVEISRLQAKLAELPEGRRGGIINAPDTGTPVELHGQEAIIPLESNQGINILRNAMSENVTSTTVNPQSRATNATNNSANENVNSTTVNSQNRVTNDGIRILRNAINENVASTVINPENRITNIDNIRNAIVNTAPTVMTMPEVKAFESQNYQKTLAEKKTLSLIREKMVKADIIQKNAVDNNSKAAINVAAPTVVNKGGNRTNAPTNNYYISNYSGSVSKDHALP